MAEKKQRKPRSRGRTYVPRPNATHITIYSPDGKPVPQSVLNEAEAVRGALERALILLVLFGVPLSAEQVVGILLGDTSLCGVAVVTDEEAIISREDALGEFQRKQVIGSADSLADKHIAINRHTSDASAVLTTNSVEDEEELEDFFFFGREKTCCCNNATNFIILHEGSAFYFKRETC